MKFDFQGALSNINGAKDWYNQPNSVDMLNWTSSPFIDSDSLEQLAFLEAKTPNSYLYSIPSQIENYVIDGNRHTYAVGKLLYLINYQYPVETNIFTPDEFVKLTKFKSFYSNRFEYRYLHEIAHQYLGAKISVFEFESFLESLNELERNEINIEICRVVSLYYVLNSFEKFFKTLLKAKHKLLREIVTSFKNQKIISGKIKILFAPSKIFPNSLRPIELAS